jgi:hypothetical protein
VPGRSQSRSLILAAACLLALTPFAWRGSPSGHDFEFHVFSWMEVLQQWKQGIFYPQWAALAHSGYGEARFLFYPPASWTLGAALGAILPWKIVPGAYCWIALMLAGVTMHRLAREWVPVPDALFAAVFYALNPYHLLIIYWRSAYAELLASALLPVLVLCILRLRGPGFRPVLALSLTFAGAWLTNAPAALMIHYTAAGLSVLLAVHALARDRSWSTQPWRPVVRAAMAVLLGAGLASFYLVPAIYEQGWINVGEVLSPGVRPQDNFLFTMMADPDHNRFNLLVSVMAAAEIVVLALAVWFSRNRRGPRTDGSTVESLWMTMSAWGASSAALMLSVSNLLWQHLPKLRFVQLPFRWLLCLNAAVALLLTMATRRWSSRLLACAILLAVVVLAGYRFQPPWWETAADIREMRDAVADGTGYEGTDEYVPTRVDPYELDKKLPVVTDSNGAPVPSEIVKWGAIEKELRIHATVAQGLTIRLFSYPAWEVRINGKLTRTTSTDVTGLIVVPVLPGDNDVRIDFCRTADRLLGAIVSLVSLLVFVMIWIRSATDDRNRLGPPQMETAPNRRSSAA